MFRPIFVQHVQPVLLKSPGVKAAAPYVAQVRIRGFDSTSDEDDERRVRLSNGSLPGLQKTASSVAATGSLPEVSRQVSLQVPISGFDTTSDEDEARRASSCVRATLVTASSVSCVCVMSGGVSARFSPGSDHGLR